MNFEKKLAKRCEKGNVRSLNLLSTRVDFASNDYLGLASSSTMGFDVIQECQRINLIGSTGSRLLTGNSLYAQDLESRIACFHGYESGLLFNCGYMANAGLLSAIPGPSDIILYDSEVHASTKDGIRLSQAMSYAFRHNDVEHLEHRLRNRATIGDCFVCVESIYSTDGSQAPLLDICSLIKKYNAHLIVDEAHAVGVCGPQGRGLVAMYNLTSDVFAQVVTFSKALGAHGAIVLGKQSLKQALINFANSFVYTTALPFSTLAAIKCSYDRFPYMDVERQKICDLIRFFQEAYLRFSDTHIQYLPCANNQHAKKIANAIQEAGIDVRALLSPTVKRGNERLRICLHAFNTQNELKNMFKHLEASYA